MTCFECDQPADHLHHVVPRSIGGLRTIPLCETCHGHVHSVTLTSHRRLTRLGLKARRDRGQRTGAVAYGYRLAGDGIHVDPDDGEQATIAAVRELHAAGGSMRAIAAELAVRGVVGRTGRPLSHTQVHRIARPVSNT